MSTHTKWEHDAGELVFPDKKKIVCKDCMFREKDRPFGKSVIDGATLDMCEVFPVIQGKPDGVLWKGAKCPYYISEND